MVLHYEEPDGRTVMTSPILIIPGIGNSGPEHWQTLWEQRHPECHRVVQREWNQPVCDEWVSALGDAIDACHSPPLLVAHSLGCLLVVHWANRIGKPIVGALLVAVPDPAGPRFPPEADGFTPLPNHRLPFPRSWLRAQMTYTPLSIMPNDLRLHGEAN